MKYTDGANMKIKDLIRELKRYKEDTEVIFKIIPPEEVCDDDTRDIPVTWYGEIGTSLADHDNPAIEFGLQYEDAEDWEEEWKKGYDRYYDDAGQDI